MITANFGITFPPNKTANLYLVDRDAYHNESEVMVAAEVPVHYKEEVKTGRTYRPDKNIAETEAVEKVVYIEANAENEEIINIIKDHDILEIDNIKYRIFDVYKGYDVFGNIQYVKLRLL